MKLEVNLDEVFSPETEDGAGVSTAELIRDAVVERVVGEVRQKVQKQLDQQLNQAISTAIETQVNDFLANALPGLMDYEFTETSSWGEKKATYTVRNRILAQLERSCTYEAKRWESDRNAFTKALDDIVSARMAEYKKSFNAVVDEKFTREALAYAEARLKEKLKVS